MLKSKGTNFLGVLALGRII